MRIFPKIVLNRLGWSEGFAFVLRNHLRNKQGQLKHIHCNSRYRGLVYTESFVVMQKCQWQVKEKNRLR